MQPGEIYLARFPFGDVPGMKLLPAQPLPSDLILDPTQPAFQTTNLKVPSALRLHKLATIHSSSLARQLGVLEAAQRSVVAAKLKTLLGL